MTYSELPGADVGIDALTARLLVDTEEEHVDLVIHAEVQVLAGLALGVVE